MMRTTTGSEAFPRTPEGRALCLGLAVVAFAVLGHVTATLATCVVGRDAAAPGVEVAGQGARDDAATSSPRGGPSRR